MEQRRYTTSRVSYHTRSVHITWTYGRAQTYIASVVGSAYSRTPFSVWGFKTSRNLLRGCEIGDTDGARFYAKRYWQNVSHTFDAYVLCRKGNPAVLQLRSDRFNFQVITVVLHMV